MQVLDLLTGLKTLSLQKKIILLFVLASVAGGVALFSFFASRPDFGVLYANLEEADAAKVVAVLQERRVPYRLVAGGRVIEVPHDQIYELRLSLAGEGLSRGGVVGFEIFDHESWGSSRYVQGINYRRALEGELARTIMSIKEIERARVHLVLPERSAFAVADAYTPKASVVLSLRGALRLEPTQVKGIVHLVSGSVDGLVPENVSVVDTEGRLLTGSTETGEEGVLSSNQVEYREAIEKSLEQSVTRMLEKVAGSGNAVVRVSAVVDFRKVESHEELYDPDAVVVRSEQNRSENMGGSAQGAAPGLDANLPDRTAPARFLQEAPSEKKEKILNYEINRVTKRTVEAPGAVQKLSVAVLLRRQDQAQDTDLDTITSLVKSAVGFDEKRGDRVEVAFMPFEGRLPEGQAEPTGTSALDRVERFLPYAMRYGGALLGVLVLVLAVLRPLLKRLAEDGQRMSELQRQLPQGLEQLEKALPAKEDRERMLEMVRKDPARAAQIVRLWLREG
ncbi:MAG: flagellar basal-body MS-ring/collar protein FliF [bacterium]